MMARKVLPSILAILTLSLCWLYIQRSGHKILSLRPKPTVVDWGGRRDEVKDAFISSWDAYEAHAWGASPGHYYNNS